MGTLLLGCFREEGEATQVRMAAAHQRVWEASSLGRVR